MSERWLPSVEDVKQFFFEVALLEVSDCYQLASMSKDRPGFIVFEHTRGDLRYQDSFAPALAPVVRKRFSGQTIIWYDETPVWVMNYDGVIQTDEPVAEFVREALASMYQKRSFPRPGEEEYVREPYVFFYNPPRPPLQHREDFQRLCNFHSVFRIKAPKGQATRTALYRRNYRSQWLLTEADSS